FQAKGRWRLIRDRGVRQIEADVPVAQFFRRFDLDGHPAVAHHRAHIFPASLFTARSANFVPTAATAISRPQPTWLRGKAMKKSARALIGLVIIDALIVVGAAWMVWQVRIDAWHAPDP